MPSQSNSNLHELISSLSKAEKRYFKIYSSKHVIGDENKYVQLFDFIAQMDVYDESMIYERFKGSSMLNRFVISKQRLYQNILKSLDSFYAESSIESNLYKLIHSAEILYRKALYKHCKKILQSAEKLALKHEKFHILLEIQLKFKKLMENNAYADCSKTEIDTILLNDQKYIETIRNYSLIWNSKSNLFYHLNKNGVARSSSEKKEYDTIIQSIDGIEVRNDFESNYLLNHTHAAYHFAVGETALSLQKIHKNIQLFQSNPDFIKSEPNIYFSTLTNAIYIHNQNAEFEEATKYVQLLKEMPEMIQSLNNEDLNIKLFSSINSIELNFLNSKGSFSTSASLEPIIEEGFRLYGNKISKVRRAYLGFNLSVAFFGIENYNASLKWLNYILNEPDLDHKEDIFSLAQLLNLIIHFELNHKQLLPYAIKSAHRYLKTRNKLYEFENVFLKYIGKIIQSPSKINQLDLLADVSSSLNELKKRPYEQLAFEYFDFAVWAKAKVQGKSYSEMIKLNYQERSK